MREPDRIIRLKTVLARTGLSRSTIYRKIAEGTFPAQLQISTRAGVVAKAIMARKIRIAERTTDLPFCEAPDIGAQQRYHPHDVTSPLI